MNIAQFGQTVQAKYPQYANMQPDQVGQMVLQKYPQYQSQIDGGSQPAQGGNNFLQNLVGDPLKTLLVQPAVRAYQAGQALLGSVTGNDQMAGAGERDVNLNIPVLGHMNIAAQKTGAAGFEQIGGDALKTAAYLAPGLSEGSVAAQAGKNALAGAAFGAGNSMQQGGSFKQVIGQAGEGALVGGGIGAAVPMAGKLADSITSSLPEALYNRALKPTLDELQKSMKYPEFQTLNQQLLERGISGSPEKLLQLAKDGLSENENALQQILQSSTGTISRDTLSQSLEPLVTKLASVPGSDEAFNQIVGILNSIPKELTVPEANVMKRAIYDTINTTAYKLDANLSTKREALKAIASGIKSAIEKETGDIMIPMGDNIARINPVQAINQNLAVFGRLQDRTLKILAQEARKSGMSLTDLITLAGGFASGHGAIGIGLDAAKKAMDSPGVLTKAAVTLKKASGASVPKIYLSGLKKGVYGAATNKQPK